MKDSYNPEDKFIKHFTSHEWGQQDVAKMQQQENKILIGSSDMIKYHGNRLVCPKCERAAYGYYKKGYAKCPKCTWWGKAVTVEEYLAARLYR